MEGKRFDSLAAKSPGGYDAIDVHAELVRLIKMTSSMYGRQAGVITLLISCSLVRLAYEVLSSIALLHTQSLLVLTSTVINCIIKFIHLLIMVHVCEQNNEKVSMFLNKISGFMTIAISDIILRKEISKIKMGKNYNNDKNHPH